MSWERCRGSISVPNNNDDELESKDSKSPRYASHVNFTDELEPLCMEVECRDFAEVRRTSQPQSPTSGSPTATSFGALDDDISPTGWRKANYNRDGGAAHQLFSDDPLAGQYAKLAIDDGGLVNENQNRRSSLFHTKRLSRRFSTADFAGKLRRASMLPGAVIKDSGNLVAAGAERSARAASTYWKPPKLTLEHRRVASINSASSRNSSVATRTFSTATSRSSVPSSRASYSSDYMEGGKCLAMDREPLGKDEDPNVITIVGAGEFGDGQVITKVPKVPRIIE
ncbi:hypothetical protein MMC13_007677 [Lambiella insularis]|nr:hypothetical protein [Lambiella insularis]